MIDFSICMVSLNCWKVLNDCIVSLQTCESSINYEVIIVDNASSDGTPENIERYFPDIHLIRNDRNVGFTKATNQAIKQSVGRYILWLNTDTVLNPDTLKKLFKFLDVNPQVGIVGPKVLNADGTFQAQCRRGMPTPLASLAYLLGLDRMWPNNSFLGQYLLTYLPVDQACQVDAVSGCCLAARREVFDSIGPLDEAIFGFGEDIDWCVRARKAGWEVWYYPSSWIIHLKGQGGAHSKPYHKICGIHQAMWVFFNKHQKSKYPWIIGLFVRLGIGISLISSMVYEGLRQVVRFLHSRAT